MTSTNQHASLVTTRRAEGYPEGVRRTTAIWRIERSDIGGLVSRIFDLRRTTPLVLISPAGDTGEPRIDPRMLEGRIRAVLAVIDTPATSLAVSSTVGESFKAHGGAVRVIWPRASARDHWRRHRLFFTYPQDDPADTIERIVEYVLQQGPAHLNVDEESRPGVEGLSSTPDPAGASAAPVELPAGVTPRLLDRSRGQDGPEPPGPAARPNRTTSAPEQTEQTEESEQRAALERLDRGGPKAAAPARGMTASGSGGDLSSGPGGDSVLRYSSTSSPGLELTQLGDSPSRDPQGPDEPAGEPDAGPRSNAPRPPVASGDISGQPAPPAELGTLDLSALEAMVTRTVRTHVREVVTDLLGGDENDEEAARERSRADALEEELDDLRRRHDAALAQVARSRTERDLSGLRVFADPAEQLRWEIETSWLLGTPEDARGAGPRQFRFGPQFLSSLSAHIVDRVKVVTVCAEVLNQTVHERRTTHPAREGAGGTRPRTREDAKMAWRVYLATNSPGAPRLMYWELKDGGVEFAVAAHHDRYDFP